MRGAETQQNSARCQLPADVGCDRHFLSRCHLPDDGWGRHSLPVYPKCSIITWATAKSRYILGA